MEELTIPAFIPSMADRIRMRVMDSDMNLMASLDDTVGTHFFKLSEIAYTSADEDLGFMPCFGPAYVNIYGAPREFQMITSDQHDAMNAGVAEGSAYRGRVMVEVVSQPGGSRPDKKVRDLAVNDESRLLGFQHRKSYSLRVDLLGLNMLSERVRDGLVQVEVGCGVMFCVGAFVKPYSRRPPAG